MASTYTALGSVAVSLGKATDAANASGSAFARVAHAASAVGNVVTAVGTVSDAASSSGSAFARIKHTDSATTSLSADAASAATAAVTTTLASAGLSTEVVVYTAPTLAGAALVNAATAHKLNVFNFDAEASDSVDLGLNFTGDNAVVVGTWFRFFNHSASKNVNILTDGIPTQLVVPPNTGVRFLCVATNIVDGYLEPTWITIDGM